MIWWRCVKRPLQVFKMKGWSGQNTGCWVYSTMKYYGTVCGKWSFFSGLLFWLFYMIYDLLWIPLIIRPHLLLLYCLQSWPRQSLHQPGRPGPTHHRDGPRPSGHVCQWAQEDHSPSSPGLWKCWNRCRQTQQTAPCWISYLCCFLPISVVDLTGGVIPPDAVLVFDVLLLDIWNAEDKVQIRTLSKPASCNRTSVVSDYIRYHYNGTLLSGEAFDSRWGCSAVWF